MSHKLPLRKRQRLDNDSPGGDGGVPREEAVLPEVPGTLITLDLIRELISNGSLSPHFTNLQLHTHRPGWLGRSHLYTEVEFGSVLYAVHVPPPSSRIGPEDTNNKHVPLLLRAFRRPGTAPSMARPHPVVLHALHIGAQSLEHWAPVSVMHVVRALSAAGVTLRVVYKNVEPLSRCILPRKTDRFYVVYLIIRNRVTPPAVMYNPGDAPWATGTACAHSSGSGVQRCPVTPPVPATTNPHHTHSRCLAHDGELEGEVHSHR